MKINCTTSCTPQPDFIFNIDLPFPKGVPATGCMGGECAGARRSSRPSQTAGPATTGHCHQNLMVSVGWSIFNMDHPTDTTVQQVLSTHFQQNKQVDLLQTEAVIARAVLRIFGALRNIIVWGPVAPGPVHGARVPLPLYNITIKIAAPLEVPPGATSPLRLPSVRHWC